jgi:uroporphyrinogen-III synthase
MTTPSFDGLRVLSFESRRAVEIGALIDTYGGRAVVAPALREVPLDSNPEVVDFAARLLRSEFDLTIFLTGVGTRELVNAAERIHPRAALIAALAATKVVARGPKPLAVLRGLQVPVWTTAPEPNTWRELLAAIETKSAEQPLAGARVAVQEYGVSNVELLDALRERGAVVTRVPVYRWALPEDVAPLKHAVTAIARDEIDVVLFTTSVQAVHLWLIASEMDLVADMERALARVVIASIGPTTSDELRRRGLPPALEASHPKIGFLVREAADQAARLLRARRQ